MKELGFSELDVKLILELKLYHFLWNPMRMILGYYLYMRLRKKALRYKKKE